MCVSVYMRGMHAAMTTKKSGSLPMYDTVGHHVPNVQSGSDLAVVGENVTYAKLSPETLLKPGQNSEYQVPHDSNISYKRLTDLDGKSLCEKKQLKILVAIIVLILMIATTVAVTLAIASWRNYTNISNKLQEVQNDMVSMKDYLNSLHMNLLQSSFESCFKDTVSCNINPKWNVKPQCKTSPLPTNVTVSLYY